MQSITLGSSGLSAPAVGFGCSALLGRSGRKASLRALHTAWDAGIRFFDVARSYGYGEAEALLGEFLQGRRDQAIIATKFGIMPARQSGLKQLAKVLARQVLAVVPQTRKLLQKGAGAQFIPGQFSVDILQRSLEESLRKLRCEAVDFLFLHDAPASVLAQGDLLEAMEKLRQAGKVRVCGISAAPEVAGIALDKGIAPLKAMQFPCNVFDLSAAHIFTQRNPQNHVLIANHPFGGVARVQQCRQRLVSLAQSRGGDATLREKLGAIDDGVMADVVLNLILRKSGIHVVLPAMMRPEHIRSNVQAVEHSRFSDDEIDRLREALSGR